MDERFRRAVEVVLQHEGGYVNDPADKGGATKYGVSSRSYPDLDIANLTKEQAMEIYYRDFWLRYHINQIAPEVIATKVLDLAVNVGPKRAVEMLQRALHAAGMSYVTVDGVIGPQTLGAVREANADMVLGALRAEAAAYYRALIERNPELKKFERGWLRRAYW